MNAALRASVPQAQLPVTDRRNFHNPKRLSRLKEERVTFLYLRSLLLRRSSSLSGFSLSVQTQSPRVTRLKSYYSREQRAG